MLSFQLYARAGLLFLLGASFSLVLNLLQVQHHIQPLKGKNLLFGSWSSPLWVPASCGLASAIVGLMYPWLDRKLGEGKVYSQEWSAIMRCVALFVGINHASAKINFSSHIQLSVSLTVLSIALWWWFDRTRSGFGMGVTIAIIATFITHLLVHHGVCKYTERDFLYVRSWLPCIVFSGGVTIGNIGRQLAVNDDDDDDGENKRHQE